MPWIFPGNCGSKTYVTIEFSRGRSWRVPFEPLPFIERNSEDLYAEALDRAIRTEIRLIALWSAMLAAAGTRPLLKSEFNPPLLKSIDLAARSRVRGDGYECDENVISLSTGNTSANYVHSDSINSPRHRIGDGQPRTFCREDPWSVEGWLKLSETLRIASRRFHKRSYGPIKMATRVLGRKVPNK